MNKPEMRRTEIYTLAWRLVEAVKTANEEYATEHGVPSRTHNYADLQNDILKILLDHASHYYQIVDC